MQCCGNGNPVCSLISGHFTEYMSMSVRQGLNLKIMHQVTRGPLHNYGHLRQPKWPYNLSNAVLKALCMKYKGGNVRIT